MQTVRGKAYNPERYKQIIDYSGLLFERGITPTDIDGALDFGGRLFVFLEFKYADAEIPRGQRLALERICDGQQREHVRSICLIARHHHPPEQEIVAADATVTEYRYLREWRKPRVPISVRAAIERVKAMPL